MIRPVINIGLGLGYVLGTLLVWIGMEMYVIDGSRLAPATLSVAAGIALWQITVLAGRSVRRRLPLRGAAAS
jgi:hypothetical protein